MIHQRMHDRREQRREVARLRERRNNDVLAEMQEMHLTWRQAIREMWAPEGRYNADGVLERYVVLTRYYRLRRGEDEPEWFRGGRRLTWAYVDWFRGGRMGAEPRTEDFVEHVVPVIVPPPPPTTLAALARDGQNVHRQVVSEQTNRNAEILLATPNIKDNLRAHELLAAVWLTLHIAPWANVRRVIDDVSAWRDKETCRIEGDKLYRRLLHALYMRIHRMTDDAVRRELWKRFYEECSEALSLCCEGHISRLCNVFVGFDDAFKPPISVGEVLQAKMSAIAQLDVSTEMKHIHANAIFEELGVPADQRTAWLEAF